MKKTLEKITLLLLFILINNILSFEAKSLPLSAVRDQDVLAWLKAMTLEEKIGQMTQVDSASLLDINDIENYHLGSLLSGGDSDPSTGNSPIDWARMYDQFQARALKTRLKIPLLYGIDAVHGHSNVAGAVIFPHNIGMGATRDPNLVALAARITAKEVRATGINWAFAPMVGLPRDKRWGRTYEGFGETAELSRAMGSAAVIGLQQTDLAHEASVLASAKHFIGDGGTTWGTGIGLPARQNRSERFFRYHRRSGTPFGLDRGDTRISEATLRQLHLPGYIAAIQSGVGTLMPSYSSWNGLKSSGHKFLLTDLLKVELGFRGFLISDWAAITELPGDSLQQIERSINAGMDMVMVPDKYREFYTGLQQLVLAGRIPIQRIDDAVARILRVKIAMGLMDPRRPVFSNQKLLAQVGSPQHRAVALRAVRQSQVLLKNDQRVLPLSKTLRHVHVAGKNAHDIGNQCGGWTITWQGKSGNYPIGGTTILQGIQKTVAPTTQVSFSLNGAGAAGADVGVVVIGETPYAEMFGDTPDLRLSPADVEAVMNIKKLGIPVVVVIISGRPLILDQILNYSDAIIASWLPGSEGQGVADVIFGNFRPTGRLPMTWPRTIEQVTLNYGDANYTPLFPYGYGLSY
jgi:beta-glucosidase